MPTPLALIPPSFPCGTLVEGWQVQRHACLDSTNLEAKRLIAQGLAEKTIIVATTQTNGQCRHNRLWESPADKGLWVSFILPVTVPLDVLPLSTLVLGVAVREGIQAATQVFLETKWPNDLLGNGKKCCGLLAETGPLAPDALRIPIVLGVGINLNQRKEDFPEYLQNTAVSLRMLANGKEFAAEDILQTITQSVTYWFGVWEQSGFSSVRTAWIAANCTLGKSLLLPSGYGYSHAIARDLDESGVLLVTAPDGTILHIDSGEICFAEPSDFIQTDDLKKMR